MENGKFFLEICADKRMQSHFLSVRDLLPETYFHCSPFRIARMLICRLCAKAIQQCRYSSGRSASCAPADASNKEHTHDGYVAGIRAFIR